jgi:hypothetical protein
MVMRNLRVVLSTATVIWLALYLAASAAERSSNPAARELIKRVQPKNTGVTRFGDELQTEGNMIALNSSSETASAAGREKPTGGKADQTNNLRSAPDAVINATTLESFGQGTGSDVSSGAKVDDQRDKVCEHNPKPKKCHPNSDED